MDNTTKKADLKDVGNVPPSTLSQFKSMVVASFFIDTVFEIEKYLLDVESSSKRVDRDMALMGLPNFFYSNGREVANTFVSLSDFMKGKAGEYEVVLFNLHYQSPYADDVAVAGMMEQVFGNLQYPTIPSWLRRNRDLPKIHRYMLFDTFVKHEGANPLNILDIRHNFIGWLDNDTLAFRQLAEMPF